MGKDLIFDIQPDETETQYLLRKRREENEKKVKKEERMVYLRNSRQKQYNRKASTTPNKTRGKTPKKRSISKTPPKISTTPNKKKETFSHKISQTRSEIEPVKRGNFSFTVFFLQSGRWH